MRGEPTTQGEFGKAWVVQADPSKGSITSFQLERPHAHPWWSWYVVSVVHLRDIEGSRPATKLYPEAEYEFQIIALHPDDPVPDPGEITSGKNNYSFLTPLNVVHQFHGLNDAQAKELCEKAVEAIVKIGISPDSDYRRHWFELINNTVQHMALGGHPKERV